MTFQEERVFQHAESVKVREFDNSFRRLASAGWKSIKLRDRVDELIWSQPLESPLMTVVFDSKHVLGISKASYLTFWGQSNGTDTKNAFHPHREPHDANSHPQLAATDAAISLNFEILAIGYRSQYVCLWDLNNEDFIGCCWRPSQDGTGTVCLYFGTILFNPNPDLSLLAIGYIDVDLPIFEPWSRQCLTVVEANALSLASTPDGRTLATGDSCTRSRSTILR